MDYIGGAGGGHGSPGHRRSQLAPSWSVMSGNSRLFSARIRLKIVAGSSLWFRLIPLTVSDDLDDGDFGL